MTLTTEEKKRIFEEEKLRQEMKGKSVLVAVILSAILPGLGDLYCGSWVKAIIFFVLDAICAFLIFVFGIGIFLYPIVAFASLISAWLSAGKSAKKRMKKVEKVLAQDL